MVLVKIDRKVLVDYLFVTLGTFLLALAVIIFWQPHDLVTGGISGLAIIIHSYTSIPISVTNLVFNLPLFIIGFKVMPREYFVRSIYGYLMLTFSFFVLEQDFIPIIDSDILMSSVFGGVVAGIGIGFVLRARATTGGSTLIAAILHRWALRHISMAKILFCVDSTIILTGLLVFGPNAAMYAVVAVFVSTKVTDAVLEGLSFSKAAFIISQEADAIADGITRDMNRGVTEMPSRGRYSKQAQTMLLCVVPAKEIVPLKQLVYNLDKKAFVIVTDVREVLGEGFKAGQDW